jgi:hypothetical protein
MFAALFAQTNAKIGQVIETTVGQQGIPPLVIYIGIGVAVVAIAAWYRGLIPVPQVDDDSIDMFPQTYDLEEEPPRPRTVQPAQQPAEAPPTDEKRIEQLLTRVLVKNGIIPTTENNPPDVHPLVVAMTETAKVWVERDAAKKAEARVQLKKILDELI